MAVQHLRFLSEKIHQVSISSLHIYQYTIFLLIVIIINIDISIMIKRGLTNLLTRGFFWKKKQSATALKTEFQDLSLHALNILQKNKTKPKLLPASSDPNKLTVVLEMDQVLVYTFSPNEEGFLQAPRRNYDHYTWFEQYETLVCIYKRKNLENFLAYLSQECEPIIFSTGVPSYVKMVMDYIDPQKKIKTILTQEHCDRFIYKDEGDDIDEFVKDLGLLNRDLSRVVYIDSKPLAFWLYPNNGLLLQEFRADNSQKSEDLNVLILQLEQLRARKDVRQYLSETYNLTELFHDSKLR